MGDARGMCPHEVEVKSVLLMDPDLKKGEREVLKALTTLRALGAKEVGTKEQMDIYLSHPSRQFSSTDESLRVRSERKLAPFGDEIWRTILTYKGPKVSLATKTRYERELILAPGVGVDEACDLFFRLGFTKAMTIRKSRKLLEMDDIEVSLDLVEGLGAFMELELVSDDVAIAERRVLDLLSRVGFGTTERRSYLELLLEKGLNR